MIGIVEVKARYKYIEKVKRNFFKNWETVNNSLPNSVSRIWVARDSKLFEGKLLHCEEHRIHVALKLNCPSKRNLLLPLFMGTIRESLQEIFRGNY